MNKNEILLPNIGVESAKVAEVYIKPGDKIALGDSILMLETDKATMEVPATLAGVVDEVLVKIGQTITQNVVICRIKQENVNNLINNNLDSKEILNVEGLNCDVLVIGGGPGGYTAAFRAADLGKKVILVEKHATLGGVCLNVGCIPSKALLHVAKVISDAKDISKHGVIFGEPKIDLVKINEYKNSVINKLTNGLTHLAKQRNVTVIKGTAKFLDAYTVNVEMNNSSQFIKFAKAIIAVGSRTFKLPNQPDSPKIMNSTDALALKDIPKTMLIVGGGIIGLEMAEVYFNLGTKITIVELGAQLIPSADYDLVKVLEERIKKRFAKIYTLTKCINFEVKANEVQVTLVGPDNKEFQESFEKILIATGRIPNGNTLDAHLAGVIVENNGFIKVNKQCQTNIEHIYAIGDVVGQPMLAHKASYEGKIAANNCSGLTTFFDARTIPSIAYTDPEIAWMGLTEKQAQEQKIAISVGKFPWGFSGRALGSGREDGFTKIIVDKKTHKILGAGIVGINAGELLAELVLALEMDCNIHDISLTIHAHPTLSETIGLACEMIDGSITDLYIPIKK